MASLCGSERVAAGEVWGGEFCEYMRPVLLKSFGIHDGWVRTAIDVGRAPPIVAIRKLWADQVDTC